MASDAGGWHVLRLRDALEQRGVTVEHFNTTRLVARVAGTPRASAGGAALDGCEGLIIRGIPIASLEQIIFRVDLLHRLENMGLRVINTPGAIEKTVDKYYTSTLLEDAGIPTPRTVVTECFDEAVAAFVELGGDVILKPLFGSEGKGMMRLNDRDLAHRMFRALEQGRYVYYLQEYIPHDDWDIRAFVLGGRLLAASSAARDWLEDECCPGRAQRGVGTRWAAGRVGVESCCGGWDGLCRRGHRLQLPGRSVRAGGQQHTGLAWLADHSGV